MRRSDPFRPTRVRSTPPGGRLAVLAVLAALVMSGCGSRVEEAASDSGTDAVVARVPDVGTGAVDPGSGPTGIVPGGSATTGNPGAVDTPVTGDSGTGTAPGTSTDTGGNKPAAGGGNTAAKPVAQGCAKQGPPVTIGQVGGFSGLVGANFTAAIKAAYVWVNYMNAKGGLNCHPIRFIRIDDQSNPALSQAAVERLVTKENAIALLFAAVPIDYAGYLAGAEKMKVATIGGDQTAPPFNAHPLVYPVGAGDRILIAGSVKQAAEEGGKKIAVLGCVETDGCGSTFTRAIIDDGWAKKFGMEVVYSGSISLTQPDFTPQCQNAKAAGADTIAWGLDKAGLQRAAKSCAALNYFPKLVLFALQASFDPTDANIRKSNGFITTPTVPYVVNGTPAMKDYHDAMAKYAPGAPDDSSGIATWASGQMLAKIVESLGVEAQTRALTKEDIFKGAANIKKETLEGLIPPTTYKVTGPQDKLTCVYGMRFSSDGTFSAPKGSKYTCL